MGDVQVHPRIGSATMILLAITLSSIAARPLAAPARDAHTVVTGIVTDGGGRPLASALIGVDGRANATSTGADGRYALDVVRTKESESVTLRARRIGFDAKVVTVALRGDTVRVNIQLEPLTTLLEQTVTTAMGASGSPSQSAKSPTPFATGTVRTSQGRALQLRGAAIADDRARSIRYAPRDSANTESYDHIDENPFRSPKVAPFSTFSADVDRASYGNVRRFLMRGTLPPKDAVRVEELVNYFPYADPAPDGGDEPLRISTEVSAAPWNPQHDLVRIALRARDVDMREAPASNLVFLIDVSGSMFGAGRLPLVKQALGLLVNQLREQDRVAIVVYAGNAGLVLPSTSGGNKQRILAALDGLEAGGSTAGGAGIKLAYDVAHAQYIRGGINRVILCTDGDFNVGQSSDGELVRLIEERRKEGAYLTILGFGMGNYKDAKMEKLAGAGNGNYGYIDDLLEARKMLVHEMGGTLVTVAKDVKLQVEFNPARVQAYRLLGYEDRILRDEDFANDAKDAGDVGAGHTVTALYEIVPSGIRLDVSLPEVAASRYQRPRDVSTAGDELLHVAMRYKAPEGEQSRLVTHPVRAVRTSPSESMRFASAVAGFGMLLRNSPNAGSLTWPQVLTLARGAKGRDEEGYRGDFIRLGELAQSLVRPHEVGVVHER
jgi:Ca-activated chloride channel homolog